MTESSIDFQHGDTNGKDPAPTGKEPRRRSWLAWCVILVAPVFVVAVWTSGRWFPSQETGQEPQGVKQSTGWEPAEPAKGNATDAPKPAKPKSPPKKQPSVRDPRPDDVVFASVPVDHEERIAFLRTESFETADTLTEDFQGQANPLSLRALLYSRFNDTDKAIETWQQCLELEPNFAYGYVGLGTIAMELGKYKEAESHYRKALELDAKSMDARNSLAECLMKQARPQEAIEVLKEDMESASKSLTSLFHLGQAHSQIKEYTEAVPYFEKAIQIEPNLTNAYYGLSNAYRRLGKREKASESLKTFRRLKEFDLKVQKQRTREADDESSLFKTAAFVHNIAGEVYSQDHQMTKAVAHWIRAAKLDPKQAAARSRLARVFTQTGNYEQVVTILRELQAIEKSNPVHTLNLGMILARMNRLDEAESAYRRAIELDPGSPVALMATAEFLMNGHRDLSEARQLAERGVSLEPSAQNFAVLAAICTSKQDFRAALRSIENALKQEPNNPDFQHLRMQLEMRVGR